LTIQNKIDLFLVLVPPVKKHIFGMFLGWKKRGTFSLLALWPGKSRP
jgi:hypothetical protein